VLSSLFSRPGGDVKVTVTMGVEEAVIAVSDTGPGVSAEDVPWPSRGRSSSARAGGSRWRPQGRKARPSRFTCHAR